MWLINTQTLELEQFFNEKAPSYVILSHTWDDQEVTFQEMKSKAGVESKKGYIKVVNCCMVARKDGYAYAWVDTCWYVPHREKRKFRRLISRSIDKTSSSELSESINSMFKWYQNSDACYVYLSDVPTLFSVSDPNWNGLFDVKGYFKKSRWFTRGWTLQELLAPSFVEFYSADWMSIGTKDRLREIITEVTGIDPRALEGEDLSMFNVAERMSWAASRQTTRQEDMAYSLLGIFQVNMPLLYGEGRRAFQRLQEEIIKTVEDYTIFTWTAALDSAQSLPMISDDQNYRNKSLFARDTADFRRKADSSWTYSDLIQIQLGQSGPTAEILVTHNEPPTLTGRGLRICLPLLHLHNDEYLAFTYCKVRSTDEWVCISLTRTQLDGPVYTRSTSGRSRTYFIKEDSTKAAFQPQTIYVTQQDPERPAIHHRRFKVLENISETLNYGFRLLSKTQYQEAEQYFKSAVALSKRIHGPSHQDTIRGVYGLLETYDSQHRYDDAELLAMDLAQTTKTSLGNKDKETLRALSYYAAMVSKQNRSDEADAIFSVLERDYCEVHGKSHHGTQLVMVRRASNMLHQRTLQEVRNYAQDIFKWFREASELPLPDNSSAIEHIWWFKRSCKRWRTAEELLSPLWQLSRDIQGEAHPETLCIMLCLAFLYNHDPELEALSLLPSETRRLKGLKMLEEIAAISLRALGRQHVFTTVSNAEINHIRLSLGGLG